MTAPARLPFKFGVFIAARAYFGDRPEDEHARRVVEIYAEYANNDGRNACPGRRLICGRIHISSKTLQDVVKRLVDEKVLVPDGTSGEYHTDRYAIDLDVLDSKRHPLCPQSAFDYLRESQPREPRARRAAVSKPAPAVSERASAVSKPRDAVSGEASVVSAHEGDGNHTSPDSPDSSTLSRSRGSASGASAAGEERTERTGFPGTWIDPNRPPKPVLISTPEERRRKYLERVQQEKDEQRHALEMERLRREEESRGTR